VGEPAESWRMTHALNINDQVKDHAACIRRTSVIKEYAVANLTGTTNYHNGERLDKPLKAGDQIDAPLIFH